MAAKLKIEKRGDAILIVHCCFSISQNFDCSYMARSSLTYIPGFSVKSFFQPIYTDYANKDHSTKVWFKLAQWLQRSWLKCEKLTDGRRTLTWPFGSGELKSHFAAGALGDGIRFCIFVVYQFHPET
jgi:hypothetical protein